jgi:TolB-like protein/tetratricopeptide (TPR) repeat protein
MRSIPVSASSAAGESVDSTQWPQAKLDSWKEIAAFFRREVRTVQLWEKSEGLPVRRQYHKKAGSVYAYRHELEDWWIARSAALAGYGKSPEPAIPSAKAKTIQAPERSDMDCAEFCRILAFPFDVIHSTLDRGPLRSIVERFAEGLGNDLAFELMRLRFHPIILPSKAIPSPGTSTLGLMKNAAREFEADVLLTGSIRYSGNQARVSVQLIRSSDSLCIWSDRFDAGMDNILTGQAELAFHICRAMPEETIRRVKERKQVSSQNDGLAFHACAMGVHYWQRRGRVALMKAVSYFQDAIELDSHCVDAYAGLADTYVSLSYNHLMPPREAASRAWKAVEAAVKLDRSSTKVRNAVINLLVHCSWDLATAERQCVELIESGKMDGRTLQLYSTVMNCRGRHHDAINLALHAYRLEPDSDFINGQVSLAFFYAGDYGSALSFIRRTIDLQPQYLMGYALLGRTEAELGNWNEAIRTFTRGLEVSHDSAFVKALLAYAYAGNGESTMASSLLLELEQESHDECFPAYDVSAVHAILNQEEEALQKMNRACGARDMKTIFVQQDPRFRRLRKFKGFHQIASAICPNVLTPVAM